MMRFESWLILFPRKHPGLTAQCRKNCNRASSRLTTLPREDEELVEKCLEIIRQEKRASTSLCSARLRLGYTRAARIVDILEQRGYFRSRRRREAARDLVDLDAAV